MPALFLASFRAGMQPKAARALAKCCPRTQEANTGDGMRTRTERCSVFAGSCIPWIMLLYFILDRCSPDLVAGANSLSEPCLLPNPNLSFFHCRVCVWLTSTLTGGFCFPYLFADPVPLFLSLHPVVALRVQRPPQLQLPGLL